MQALLRMTRALADGSWTGDKDELPFAVPAPAWDRVTTDRQACAGSRCPQFGQCPFYAARQRVKAANLIVANHDQVLSALEMPAGSVLPDPAEAFIIFDEAHSLKDKGIAHFAEKHPVRGAAEWVADIADALRDIVHALRIDARPHVGAAEASRDLAGALGRSLRRHYRNGCLRGESSEAVQERRAAIVGGCGGAACPDQR